jgi:O-antigen ligase
VSWYAPQRLPESWLNLQGARTTGSLEDPDLYAAMLTFCGLILIHSAVNRKKGLVGFGFLLTSSLCAIFAFLSLERAAWLGGLFVTIGLLIFYPRTMFRLIILASIVFSTLGIGILSSPLALSVERLSHANPIFDRVVVFDAMLQMFRMKPVWGWGYETLDDHVQQFYRQVGEASILRHQITSHNTYLTILTELGLVGFILYMFPVVWWFVLSIRVWRRLPKDGLWSRSLLAVLWLAILFQFTVSNFIDMRWFEIGLTLWWLTLGLIANVVYPYLRIHINEPRSHRIGLHA